MTRLLSDPSAGDKLFAFGSGEQNGRVARTNGEQVGQVAG